jgi:hypothetical protein
MSTTREVAEQLQENESMPEPRKLQKMGTSGILSVPSNIDDGEQIMILK